MFGFLQNFLKIYIGKFLRLTGTTPVYKWDPVNETGSQTPEDLPVNLHTGEDSVPWVQLPPVTLTVEWS